MSGPAFAGAVHWSQQDLDHAKRQIELGLLPRDYIERHFEDERKAVFGENYQTDPKTGLPVEHGRGSKAQPTEQSVAAYKKYGTKEPNYEETLAEMEAALAAYQQVQERHRHRGRQQAGR
jgi:hypothetical protein